MPEQPEKEIISREEFERRRNEAAELMARDEALLQRALDVKVAAGHDYMWVHQGNWMGEPCLQLPTDLMAIAEVVFKSKPKYVIECGVAWGGTTLFLASLLSMTGGDSVIGLDIYIPTDLRTRLSDKGAISEFIQLHEVSTTETSTIDLVRRLTDNSGDLLILLDSHHTHDHVLAELKAFAPLLDVGKYLIVGDTAIERQPPAPLRPRPWGRGNSPASALSEYLSAQGHVDFEVDENLENKLLMSNNWGGYLRRRS
jgi:cephalosporin hydroxylase